MVLKLLIVHFNFYILYKKAKHIVLMFVTGVYSRRDSVIEQGCFSDESNNKIQDKRQQAFFLQFIDHVYLFTFFKN